MKTIVFLIIASALFEGILCARAIEPKAGNDAFDMEQIYETNVPEDLREMNMNNFMNLVGAYQMQQNDNVRQKKQKPLQKSRSKINLDEEKMLDAEETSAILPSLKKPIDQVQQEQPELYNYEERNDGIYLNNKLIVATSPGDDVSIMGSKVYLDGEEVFDAKITGTCASSSKKETSVDETETVENKEASTPEPKTSDASKATPTKKRSAAKKKSAAKKNPKT